MAPDGTGAQQLTRILANQRAPAWSPDGTRIAFESDMGSGSNQIYLMKANGKGMRRLEAGVTTPSFNGPQSLLPSWSPDGKRIAFARQQGTNSNIYVMNADGTDATALTTESGTDAEPAWSPDGMAIAFTSQRTGSPQIFVMNANGTNVVRVTNSSYARDPAWSPDGTRIAFSCQEGSTLQICIINADGSGLRQLTFSASGFSHHPTWSPDGQWIAFVLGANQDKGAIYVVTASGGTPTDLTPSSTSNADPAWGK